MVQCSHCRRSVEVHGLEAPHDATFGSSFAERAPLAICPHCGGRLKPAAAADWTAVARVANLAEAGYLANDLSGHGIDSRIFELENFNALVGEWTTAYAIQVPTAAVSAAAAQLRNHLADESDVEPSGESRPLFGFDEGPVDPVFWRPVALMLIAGVASFIVGQRCVGDRQPVPQPPPRDSLAASVQAVGRAFVTEPDATGTRHRLSYNSRAESWYLESDADGDGHFEACQRFRRHGASW